MERAFKVSKFLFLDRDGVINIRPMNDYVKTVQGFEFEFKALDAITMLSRHFEKIFVVTNQQGVGKGLMTAAQVEEIHAFFIQKVKDAGGKIDSVYFCPHLRTEHCICRKPNVGLGLKARKQFTEVQFSKSIMVGDTLNDMRFGKKLQMQTVLIGDDVSLSRTHPKLVDSMFESLFEFASYVDALKK